jgi:hypothetical protein
MRKTATITIAAEGRDKGKVFQLKEMPASQAERWAMKVFLALAKSGVDIPEDVMQSGMAGIAAIGFKALAGMNYYDVEPLMDEMFQCVQAMPDPGKPAVLRNLIEDDIEEVKTRLVLRKEILLLHVNFSPAAGSSQ